MTHRTRLALAVIVLAFACAPGADVNGFPSALANAYCHFAYHCCTPADRTTFPSGFSNLENTYVFDNESDCDAKLGEAYQAQFQEIQASVKDKRMTWNQTSAQTCLTALQNAANPCSAQAFTVASNGDPNNPTALAACDATQFETGAVAAGAVCTIDADCAGQGSVCTAPTPDAGTVVIQTGGTCVALPAAGSPCRNGSCAAGACCLSNTNTCTAYQAAGAACVAAGGFGTCTTQPCDPTTDYCNYNANGSTCMAKIANGTACAKDQFGGNDSTSCQSGYCDSTSNDCAAVPGQQVTYDICTGNADGL
jgi:hypothetical protein